eukprot:TRINITY_DN4363_c0_g1_i1.p1 TRINITY_DN4363_c0_g1~~TRINITY_DN4363_c0_g1_i1.p1  ORF type:complete len:910 (+),score=331.98 TRINITY_DN4363_c0_g1_i1:865-3594(+)
MLTDNKNYSGAQGYLKVSITVLGEGDEGPTHGEDEDEEGDAEDLESMILRPPQMDLIGYNLCVSCFKAEDLPKMDMMGSIDAYCSVQFGGNEPACTKVIKNNYDPEWYEEVRVPVWTPTLSNAITFGVYDSDAVGSDDLVASTEFKFTEVQIEEMNPRWFNLYGLPRTSLMADLGNMGSDAYGIKTDYLGRVLLGMRADQDEDPMLGIKSISPCAEPETDEYLLRFDLYEAAELPTGLMASYVTEVMIGPHQFRSEKQSSKKGFVKFYEAFEEEVLDLPIDRDSIPHIFVNVYKVGALGGEERVGYLSYTYEEIRGFKHKPEWKILKPDKLSAAYNPDRIPGFLLCNLNFGKKKECKVPRPAIKKPELKKYLLRAHMYQGKHLPVADSTGVSDPYCVVQCGHFYKSTSIKEKTLFPMWYESLEMEVELPANLDLAPDVMVTVFDHDTFGSDEFLGRFEVQSKKVNSRFAHTPKWHEMYKDNRDEHQGSILASFQLIPEEDIAKFPAPETIVPQMKDCVFEISVVGLRNMLPYLFADISNPWLEFDCGDRSNEENILRTQTCNEPSGKNPNHLEVLRMPIQLPLNPLYAPTINMRVYDRRLGVACEVGSASIPIGPFMPWTNMEIPRHNLPPLVDDVPGGDNSDDTGLGSSANQLVAANKVQLDEIPLDVEDCNQEMDQVFEFTSPEDAGLGIRTLDETPDVALPGDEEVEEEKSVLDRVSTPHELEHMFSKLPFDEYPIYRGKAGSWFNSLRVVGKFKGQFRVLEAENADREEPIDLKELYEPMDYVIRVYVLYANSIVPMDSNGKADPYVTMWNGTGEKNKINDKENGCMETLTPQFFKMYELDAVLPGNSELHIELYDYDMIGFDELIGETVIDLENRWFSEEWGEMLEKPTEFRSLWHPASSFPQG